ncbi:hypothetical protein [Macrococcus bovicus]|uniref:hypothetical protein n=1 Tax=Macrococcus bovicus TaxID=69968 RepID=UPI0025A4CDA3|nr:hypothetical protein [Macrococcus bovicus]WJP97109.1 hypothetical protein QSV55_07430 [Macrococcus bovicus]
MKHIREWKVDGLEAGNVMLYSDEKTVSLCRVKRGVCHVLALLEYYYTDNESLVVKTSDDYMWILDADMKRQVLTIDFRDDRLNGILNKKDTQQ